MGYNTSQFVMTEYLMTHESSIALLVDADNSPAGKIEEVLGDLAKYGVINIRRAYGDWKNQALCRKNTQ